MDEYIKKSEINNLIQNGIQNYMNTKQFNLSKIPNHTHNGIDSVLITRVDLPIDNALKVGLGAMASISNNVSGTGEQIQTAIVCGKETGGAKAFDTTSNNMQLALLHQPNNTSNQSFIVAFRPPLYSDAPGTSITTTSGGSTVQINGYNFTTNSLAGAVINIYNSSGAFVESKMIASNTIDVITITGTWASTTTGGIYVIFQPVFMGSANFPFQRFYAMESTDGGIRFGIGATAGGQNGLLYMDSTGDLYWRNKAGASAKLN